MNKDRRKAIQALVEGMSDGSALTDMDGLADAIDSIMALGTAQEG